MHEEEEPSSRLPRREPGELPRESAVNPPSANRPRRKGNAASRLSGMGLAQAMLALSGFARTRTRRPPPKKRSSPGFTMRG